MSLVELTQVVLERSPRFTLGPVSLQIKPGECLAVLGENGSGKSTLLACLADALPLSSGQITLEDQPLHSLTPQQRAKTIAVVPQSLDYGLDFTVFETVLLGRFPRSPGLWETPQDKQIAETLLEKLDLSPLKDARLSEISGGERQRALIARSLAQEPKLLLLDEPTAHLDVRHHARLAQTVQDLKAQGIALLVTSHDIPWITPLADKALLLREGKAVAQGDTANVINPENLQKTFGVEFESLKSDSGHSRLVPRSY